MTEKLEAMSALMDGEHSDNDIIKATIDDATTHSAWSRYHLARSVMRKEVAQGPVLDISAQIAQALEQEPTVLAPNNEVDKGLLGKMTGRIVPFARQTGQFAVAASVAAAVILGVQTYNQPETIEPFVTAPPISTQGGLSPVSLNQTQVLPAESRQQEFETRRQIQALLTDHEQQVKLKSTKADESDTEEESSK